MRKLMDQTPPLYTEAKFTPKTYDIDFQNHVNNIVYVRWMEDLRILWLDTFFPLKPMIDQGIAPALTETTIQYKQPIHLFEEITAAVWVSGVKGARSTLEFSFKVNGRTVSMAKQEVVWINVNSGRPVRSPKMMLEMWNKVSRK